MNPAILAALGSRMASFSATLAPAARVMSEIGQKKVGDLGEGAIRKTFSQVSSSLSKFSDGVLSPLKPLSLLTAAMQTSVSGSSVYQSSLKLLATVIGTALTPVFVIFAIGVQAAATWLADKLIPALGEFYNYMAVEGVHAFNVLLPSIQDFGRGLVIVTSNLYAFAKFVKGLILPDQLPTLHKLLELRDPRKVQDGGDFGSGDGGPAAPAPKGEPTAGDRVKSAMNDVMKMMEKANQKPVEYGNIQDLAKKAQLAFLNQDPNEVKMLEIQKKMLEEFIKQTSKIESKDGGLAFAG